MEDGTDIFHVLQSFVPEMNGSVFMFFSPNFDFATLFGNESIKL